MLRKLDKINKDISAAALYSWRLGRYPELAYPWN
jgi:hypothetical protein